MEEAIERLRSVPTDQQDEVARFVLNELQEDERWAATTVAHADQLQKLIDQVLVDDDCGLCGPLDPDKL